MSSSDNHTPAARAGDKPQDPMVVTSMRSFFAGQAMQALLSREQVISFEAVAEDAWVMADLMLERQ